MTYSQIYFQRARRVASLLRCVPFLRLVGLNGSVANGTATRDSDIDFLIVSQHGRLWTCRFFVTAIVWLLGVKRQPQVYKITRFIQDVTDKKKIAGKICLNLYLTDDFLDIRPHSGKVAGWYRNTIPLVDRGDTFRKLVEKNKWLFKKNSKIQETITKPRGRGETNFNIQFPNIQTNWFGYWLLKFEYCLHLGYWLLVIERLLSNVLGSRLERRLQQMQLKRIKIDPPRVMISDRELRFHPEKNN